MPPLHAVVVIDAACVHHAEIDCTAISLIDSRRRRLCVQVGFMSFYALPMFDAMSEMFPEMMPMTKAVQANFQTWSDMPKHGA